MTDAVSLKASGVINANINIGGYAMSVNVNTSNVGVSLDLTVDIGGLAITNSDFNGTNSTRRCSAKSKGYDTASNKFNITATVGLGGGTLRKSLPYSSFLFNP